MRDRQHIERVLEVLGDAWRRSSDLRLGQLLLAAIGDRDLFHLEDEELLAAVLKLKAFLEAAKQGSDRYREALHALARGQLGSFGEDPP